MGLDVHSNKAGPVGTGAIATFILCSAASTISFLAFAQQDDHARAGLAARSAHESVQKQSKTNHRPPGIAALDENRLESEARWLRHDRPLYTPENRRDLFEIRDDVIKQQVAASVALIRADKLSNSNASPIRLATKTLGASKFLCSKEKFSTQLSAAFCSGTLVGKDLVVTAGHCVAGRSGGAMLNDIRFVFGYSVGSDGAPGRSEFFSEQVYKAKAIVAKAQVGRKLGADWALVQLSGTVPDSVARPISQIAARKIVSDEAIYVIGYPSGIPVKYSTAANVVHNAAATYFVANLNAFDGNSGSGVFASRTNYLVGILVGGDNNDYYWDDSEGCSRPYMCPKGGCTGEYVNRIESIKLAR